MKRFSEKGSKIAEKEIIKKASSSSLPKEQHPKFNSNVICTNVICKTKELMFNGKPFKNFIRDFATLKGSYENFSQQLKPYNTPINGEVYFDNPNDPIPTLRSSYGKFHNIITTPCKIPGKVIITGKFTHSQNPVIDPSSGNEITPEFLCNIDVKGNLIPQYVIYFSKPLLVKLVDIKFSLEATNYLNDPYIKSIVEPKVDDLCKDIQKIL